MHRGSNHKATTPNCPRPRLVTVRTTITQTSKFSSPRWIPVTIKQSSSSKRCNECVNSKRCKRQRQQEAPQRAFQDYLRHLDALQQQRQQREFQTFAKRVPEPIHSCRPRQSANAKLREIDGARAQATLGSGSQNWCCPLLIMGGCSPCSCRR